VYGVIESKRIYWGDVFTEELGSLLATLVANPDIAAIVLDIDSPGGSVYGVQELADQIRGYRSSKPIYSVATGMEASAAYWNGSAATKAFASPSSQVGSIGVWTAHVDISKMLEEWGVKITLVSAGKYKVEGNMFEELGEEAKAAIQGEVDVYYGHFAEGVAKNRNRRASTVKGGFGEGRLLVAERALDEGLIDGIATLPEVLGAIVPRRKGSRSASARARLALEEAGD
jgi:signal peptide peptidase SppA